MLALPIEYRLVDLFKREHLIANSKDAIGANGNRSFRQNRYKASNPMG